MATAKNGPLGPASGKVARLVFYNLRGQEVIRSIGEKPEVTAPDALMQREKMTVLMAFFDKVGPFIKVGFKNEAMGTTLHYQNVATGYNLVHAIGVEEGKAVLQYERLLLCRGSGLVAQNAQAITDDTGITFSWDINPSLPWITNQDQVMMLACFPEINEALFNVAGVVRRSGSDHLNLPPSFQTLRMEIYIAFVAEDRESISRSIYLGRIN